ncbi:hypothetical protein [Caldibacillus debilis]|uniref:hypothetical protein n=1 Tax=Caldibacillus debilis TaxID=301148 RepID=UPI0023F0F0B7|nr:hypothetical protein [Caldibacillus debilis]
MTDILLAMMDVCDVGQFFSNAEPSGRNVGPSGRKAKGNVERFIQDVGQTVSFFERFAKNVEHFSLAVEPSGREEK